MRTQVNGIEAGVFEKDWGREVYFETVEDTCNYLNSKNLDFISNQVKSNMEGVSAYKELCVSETKDGYVLEVGRCGFGSFEYFTLYRK